jgi:hypothetical protein
VDEFEVLTNTDKIVVKDEPDFMVFPNPFNESFVLKFNNSIESGLVKVYDISGRLVETVEISNHSDQINLGLGWNPGIYFVTSNGKTVKIVKTK